MPVDTFTSAELADFEKNFKPAAAPVKAAAESQPAGDSASTQDDTHTATDSASSEQTSESSTEDTDTLDGDDVVESSAADTTPADASDESETADLTSETVDTQPQKPRSRAQERIESLVASNKALKASLEHLQSEVLAKLSPQQAPEPAAQTSVAASAEEAPPTLESCGFDTDRWTQAMQAWTKKQVDSGVKRAVETVHQNQTEDARKATFQSRLNAFDKATPDLKVILGNPALPKLAKDAAELVVDSELGPQILYHLGKNPEKAASIARLSPVKQAAAIGRIEAEIQAAAKTAQKTKTNTISRAPAPPNPTAGRGNTPTVDPAKLSTTDWIEMDRKQTEERRRAKGRR